MSTANGSATAPKPKISTQKISTQKVSSQMKDFLALGKKIFQDKDICDYDQLIDEKKSLTENLRLKTQELDAKGIEFSKYQSDKTNEINTLRSRMEEEIAKLKLEKQTLFNEFQNQYASWNTGTNRQKQLKNEVDELRGSLTQAENRARSFEEKADTLRNQLFEHQNTLTVTKADLMKTKKELNSKEMECEGAMILLETYQTKLEAQRKELGLENPNPEELSEKLSDLAHECHKLAKRFFRTQLPQELITNGFRNELKNSGFIQAAPKKMPLSNSMAAQCLRMATAEKIIADKLCTNIFREYYLPISDPARNVIDDILKRLDKTNSGKEAIFRAQLLAAYEPDEQDYTSQLVESTTGEVFGLLDPLLFAPDARENFQSALKELLTEAVKLWWHVQRSAMKGQVQNDPEYRGPDSDEDPGWDYNGEYTKAVELSADQMAHVPDPGEPVMSLFPQVSLGGEVVYDGCALWSDQNAVFAAGLEFTQLNSRKLALGRGPLGQRDSDGRRLSMSGSSSGGRRADDLATSPKSSSGNRSFLEHTNGRKMSLPGPRPGELGGNTGGG